MLLLALKPLLIACAPSARQEVCQLFLSVLQHLCLVAALCCHISRLSDIFEPASFFSKACLPVLQLHLLVACLVQHKMQSASCTAGIATDSSQQQRMATSFVRQVCTDPCQAVRAVHRGYKYKLQVWIRPDN